MTARITWLLLWPVLLVTGYASLLIQALTCGDDGPADYGDSAAIEFCRRVDQVDDAVLFVVAGLPLAALALGVVVLGKPRWLTYINRVAFLLSGAILALLSAAATAVEFAVLVSTVWATVAGIHWLWSRPGSP